MNDIKELAVQVEQVHVCMNFLVEFFDGDYMDVTRWWYSANPAFGDSSPNTLVIAGRGHKVLEFILSAMEKE